MTDRLPSTKYVIDPIGKLHRRWRDHHGPLRVIGEPAEGWVMLKEPGPEPPFCVRLSQLLNATSHPKHGPFEPVGAKVRHVKMIDLKDISHAK